VPRVGDYVAWLGGEDNEISQLSQEVVVPPGNPVLRFYIQIDSADTCGYDDFFLLAGGEQIRKIELCQTNNSTGWILTEVDLNSVAGQKITLAWRVETDSSSKSNLFVDDISLTGGSNQIFMPMLRK
jgi:hypothetical protein